MSSRTRTLLGCLVAPMLAALAACNDANSSSSSSASAPASASGTANVAPSSDSNSATSVSSTNPVGAANSSASSPAGETSTGNSSASSTQTGSSGGAATSKGSALVVPLATTSATAPRIFGSSTGAQPGNTITLQGVNFAAGSEVWLATSGAPIQLPVVSGSTSSQLAAELPSSVSGDLIVWITNSAGTSNAVTVSADASSCT